MAALPGVRTSSDDPNHPPELDIAPSSRSNKGVRLNRQADGRRRSKEAAPGQGRGECAVTAADVRDAEQSQYWDQDSATDIQKWGIAGRIWEAAYLFRLYIEASGRTNVRIQFDPSCSIADGPSSPLRPSRSPDEPLHILELGSGVGYVGLACARALERAASEASAGEQTAERSPALPWREASVVLTDLDNVCDLMCRNARLAGFDLGQDAVNECTNPSTRHVSVLVRALPWGSQARASAVLAELQARREELTLHARSGSSTSINGATTDVDVPLRHPVDYILCSDLVYFPALLAPLLRSLISLTKPSGTTSAGPDVTTTARPPTVLIAYKIRSFAKEEPFWNTLGIWFDVEIVACRHFVRQHREDQTDWSGSAPPDYGPWHHFGSWKRDLEIDLDHADATPAQESAGDNLGEQERNEESYFIFVAHRKAETYGYDAPAEDRKLMDGWMAERPASTGQEEQLTRGQGGADFLEWALMGGMDVGDSL